MNKIKTNKYTKTVITQNYIYSKFNIINENNNITENVYFFYNFNFKNVLYF